MDPLLAGMSNDAKIPSLAFGLYKVPVTEEGEAIISDAIAAGYRHFDSASLYGNERVLGNAIRKSGIPREQFVVSTKVWNDAQKEGRAAVRASVEKSLKELDCGPIDIFYIHWPVPGHSAETYRELQDVVREGNIRYIGLSNFGIAECEEILQCKDIDTVPLVNQMEVSPFMYRPETIKYFQDRSIAIAASKALHRASGIDGEIVGSIAQNHQVTPAQVLIRWGFQKRLIVVAKTANKQRMKENRSILGFSLSEDEMAQLDSLTDEEAIRQREELEIQRRQGT
jgi:diketogulonate reductase-like aldo/keto reductase